MKHTHKPQSDETLKAMRERNAKRVAIVKRVMGTAHILHPMNQVQRKDAQPQAHFIIVPVFDGQAFGQVIHRVH